MGTPRTFMLLSSLVWLALTACAGDAQFRGDHGDIQFNQYYDFSHVKKIWLAPAPEISPQAPAQVRQNQAHARTAIQRELSAHGFQLVGRSDADLWLKYTVGSRLRSDLRGMGGSTRVGGMSIDFVDPTTNEEVWEAWMSKTWYESMNAQNEIDKAAARILSHFPPKR
jgi:hypothetical protein